MPANSVYREITRQEFILNSKRAVELFASLKPHYKVNSINKILEDNRRTVKNLQASAQSALSALLQYPSVEPIFDDIPLSLATKVIRDADGKVRFRNVNTVRNLFARKSLTISSKTENLLWFTR
jgi:hypothetical protein